MLNYILNWGIPLSKYPAERAKREKLVSKGDWEKVHKMGIAGSFRVRKAQYTTKINAWYIFAFIKARHALKKIPNIAGNGTLRKDPTGYTLVVPVITQEITNKLKIRYAERAETRKINCTERLLQAVNLTR